MFNLPQKEGMSLKKGMRLVKLPKHDKPEQEELEYIFFSKKLVNEQS